MESTKELNLFRSPNMIYNFHDDFIIFKSSRREVTHLFKLILSVYRRIMVLSAIHKSSTQAFLDTCCGQVAKPI